MGQILIFIAQSKQAFHSVIYLGIRKYSKARSTNKIKLEYGIAPLILCSLTIEYFEHDQHRRFIQRTNHDFLLRTHAACGPGFVFSGA